MVYILGFVAIPTASYIAQTLRRSPASHPPLPALPRLSSAKSFSSFPDAKANSASRSSSSLPLPPAPVKRREELVPTGSGSRPAPFSHSSFFQVRRKNEPRGPQTLRVS